jgi:hypothetical protein
MVKLRMALRAITAALKFVALRETETGDLLNIFAEKFGENIGGFAQTTASFSKNLMKNANFLAENCDPPVHYRCSSL